MIASTQADCSQVMIAAVLFLASSVAMAQVPPEGKYDYTACWSGVSNPIAFSKRHTAFTYEMTGTTRAAQAGGFADKNTFRCIGLNMVFEGKLTGTAICEAVDKDGHKLLSKYDISGPSAMRTQLEGTGKYEGLVMVADPTKTLGPFPTIKEGTFQNCNHQTGTYKLMKRMN
jgi:hypothetical protein